MFPASIPTTAPGMPIQLLFASLISFFNDWLVRYHILFGCGINPIIA